MPVYEYKCDSCGEVFELIQKFADEPLKVHQKCGGPVHRLLSAPALQFKGSGWYVTDYAKGNSSSSPAHKSDSSGSSKDGDSSKEGSSSKSDNGDKAASKPASAPASTSSSSDSKS